MIEMIGRQRITRLATAILRGGGVVAFPTAMAMLRENKQATSRTLEWLVKAGMLRKIRVPGGSHVWMSERTLVRTYDPNEKPAVYKLSRQADRWTPGPTFDHDQLALRVLFSLAEPWDLLTEHEIRRTGRWEGRVPDGVLRLTDSFLRCEILAELEVETSRKTGAVYRPNGTQGGWAKLAEKLYRVCHDWIGGRQSTSLGMTDATLIVASRAHADAIRKKIAEVDRCLQSPEEKYVERDKEATLWYYAELLADGTVGQPEFDLLA